MAAIVAAGVFMVGCGRDYQGVLTPAGGRGIVNAATTKTCQLGDGQIRHRDSLSAANIRRMPFDWQRRGGLRSAGLRTLGPMLSVVSSSTPVTEIVAPDSTYRGATKELSAIDGTVLSEESFNVTMDAYGRVATVPDCWRYWSSPPYSESVAPPDSVIVIETRLAPYEAVAVESLNLGFSSPLKWFGIEIESECYYGDCATLHAYAEYFNRDTLIASTTTSLPDTRGGARLVALRSDGKSFDRVRVRVMDNAGVKEIFAIAHIRYAVASKLRVTCTPNSVTRSDEIRCAMRAPAPSTVEAISWRFENPQVDTEVHLVYPEYGETPDTVWAGPLVIGGTVWGFGKVDGAADSAQASVSGRSRPWRQTFPTGPRPTVSYLGQGALPPVPLDGSKFGKTEITLDLQLCRDPFCKRVDRGPNRKLKYYLSLPYYYKQFDVSINIIALAPGSWWRNSLPSTRQNGRCSRSDVASIGLFSMIEQHEGRNPDVHVNSHTRVFRDVVDTIGPTIIEAAIDGVIPRPDSLVSLLSAAADAESRRVVDDTSAGGRNPLKPPCRIP